jgi:hypothetical protein
MCCTLYIIFTKYLYFTIDFCIKMLYNYYVQLSAHFSPINIVTSEKPSDWSLLIRVNDCYAPFAEWAAVNINRFSEVT